MGRNILAVIVGLFVGSCLNMALVMANMALFPMPDGVTFADPEGFKAYIAGLPATAFLLPIAAHMAQAFGGGWVAARISKVAPMGVALVVGGLSLLGGIMNMINIQGPAWMWIEMPGYLAVAWAAGKLELKRRGEA